MGKSGILAPERSYGYGRDVVEVRAEGEPEWLAARRFEAWDVFEAKPLPTTRGEDWRYTDPKLLKWNAVKVADGSVGGTPDAARARMDGLTASGRAVQVGAAVASIELDPALEQQGVLLLDLAAAARDYPDLVREHLGTRAAPPTVGKFAALNGALWSGGLFL